MENPKSFSQKFHLKTIKQKKEKEKLINEAMKQRKRLRVLIVKKSVINDFGFSLLSSYELLSFTKMIPTCT
jgi:hypothetical protein